MTYGIDPDETISTAIRRCAREQLEDASRKLSEEIANDPVEAVHSARKSLKKERALLRLARGTLTGAQRREENLVLRDAARSLSGARDADVMIQSLDALSERFAGQTPDSTFKEVRKRLVRARTAERARLRRNTPDGEVVEVLHGVESRIDAWRIKREGWRAIEPGLLRTYRRGRKAARQAQAQASLENLHAWRKRVKDLWYQLRLLAPTSGPAVQGQADEAHVLSDLLGDDHDLGVLRETVVQMRDDIPADTDALLGLIDHRREQLQTEALYTGRRLYAEKPKAFVRRMRRYWEAGRAQATAEHDRDPAELAELTR